MIYENFLSFAILKKSFIIKNFERDTKNAVQMSDVVHESLVLFLSRNTLDEKY